MALRSDSYGTVAEVVAFTRPYLDGNATFNSTTRPTLTEVEKFVDRVSGALNVAIAGEGFTPSSVTANSTAKLMLDDWAVTRAAALVELTHPMTPYGGQDSDRASMIHGLYTAAAEFVASAAIGWKRLGISITDPSYQGLTFTALNKHGEQADPDSTTLEQPKFRRGQFEND